jgi:Uma2 family endonuclease
MSSQPKTFLTPEEYLEYDRRAEYRSEYYQGEMFAMSGGTRYHSLIITNLVREFGRQLKGRPCEIYSNTLRLRTSPTGLYTYPDVVVACGDIQFADNQKDTLLNPSVIIEVLSDSTRDYDRGLKFQQYRTLASLAEYLTVAQDAPHVEHWKRQPENRWLLAEYGDPSASIALESIGCVLPLSEVYDRITF